MQTRHLCPNCVCCLVRIAIKSIVTIKYHSRTGSAKIRKVLYSHPPKVSDKARRRRQYAFVRRGDATPYEAFGGWLYMPAVVFGYGKYRGNVSRLSNGWRITARRRCRSLDLFPNQAKVYVFRICIPAPTPALPHGGGSRSAADSNNCCRIAYGWL